MRKSITTNETIETWKGIKTFLQASDTPHEITLTTYTQKITSAISDCNLYLIKENHPIKIFATAKKIEKAVLNSKKEIPFVGHNQINYFSFFNQSKSIFEKEIYCLDINSAYPTALKILNWIDEKTFQELMKLPKKSRLVSVGMLGSTKRIFTFNGKELTSYREEEKKTKGVFMDVCRYVGEVLTESKMLLKNNFLFFWVDGIYFLKNEETEKNIQNIISLWEKKGFSGKCELLTDFYFLNLGSKFEIQFSKNGKKKIFNLPLNPSNKTFLE